MFYKVPRMILEKGKSYKAECGFTGGILCLSHGQYPHELVYGSVFGDQSIPKLQRQKLYIYSLTYLHWCIAGAQ